MNITIQRSSTIPIYKQIVTQLTNDIENGILAPKTQLPTVRHLAHSEQISCGTVKRAYDILEKQGLILKLTGSGCFVNYPATPSDALRTEGIAVLHQWITDMREKSFSLFDIRIMMDECLRTYTYHANHVRIAAIDCNPEALAVMKKQFGRIPYVDVSDYLLDTILESPHSFDPDADIIITTPTHYKLLAEKTHPRHHIIQLVLSIATGTALDLAAIPKHARVGILCASKRFGEIISDACAEYADLDSPPKIAYADDFEQALSLVQNCTQIISAPNLSLFFSTSDLTLLKEYSQKLPPITYQYQIEKGSLLFLEEQVSLIYEKQQQQQIENILL